MTEPTLHGRGDDLKDLLARKAGVVVIAGDSGIGKSELLARLGVGWSSADVVAGAAVLGATQGSLQSAIADAIGDCLRQHLDEHPDTAKHLGQTLLQLMDRAISATAKEASRLVVARLFTAIESKLGKEVADATRGVLTEVLKPTSAGFDDRLQRLVTVDLATELLSVVDGVSALTGRRLVLRFDRAELLNPADLALLGELADRSIDSLLILISFGTSRPEHESVLTTLETRGAERHNLVALREPAIRDWLTAENVAPEVWPQVIRLSSGYPFFISDAIRLHHDGLPPDQLGAPNGFNALLRQSWQVLDLALQELAMRVAGFADPPNDAFLTRYLGIDAVAWSVTKNQLMTTGVFISRPDGAIWFHDRRRNFIWLELMSADARALAADASIETIRAWLEEHELDDWTRNALPNLLRFAAEQTPPDSHLKKLTSLTEDDLSVLFALIELVEPGGELGPFADTNAAGSYAAMRFGTGDPIESFERLASLGLVVSSANDHVSISTVVSPDVLSHAALLSEIESGLHQRPVPRFASTTFERILRPMMGDFQLASMSVGHGSLRTHRDAHESLASKRTDGLPAREIPAMGIVIKVDGQAVTTTAIFSGADKAAAALERVRAYEREREQSEPEIVATWSLPTSRIRYGRFGDLVKDLALDKITEPTGSAVEVALHLERQIRASEIIRQHLTEEEASAFGWREARSTLLDVRDDQAGWATISIEGGTHGELRQFRLADDQKLFGDPLLELKLRRDGILRPEEHVRMFTVNVGPGHTSASHPLEAVADELEKQGRAYNRGLAAVRLDPDSQDIAPLIKAERASRRRIAQALFEASLIDPVPSTDSSLYLFLQPRSIDVFGASWFAQYFEVNDGEADVRVQILPPSAPPTPWHPTPEDAQRLGIPDVESIARSGGGYADGILAGFLGFEMEDVRVIMTPATLALLREHVASEGASDSRETD